MHLANTCAYKADLPSWTSIDFPFHQTPVFMQERNNTIRGGRASPASNDIPRLCI